MPLRPLSPPPRIGGALLVALVYALLSLLWILLSDRLLEHVAGDVYWLTSLQTFKGTAFVGATTVLIYLMVRRLENARSAQGSYYRALFAATATPTLLLGADDGCVADANPAACRLYGFRLAELRGLPLKRLTGPGASGIEGRQRHFDAAGGLVEVEVSSQVLWIGQQSMRVLQITDLTERLRLERERRDAERDFHEALSTTLFVLYRYDIARDAFDYISPLVEAWIGVAPVRLCTGGGGALLRTHIHPDDLERLAAENRSAFITGEDGLKHLNSEFRLLTRSGDYRWMLNAKSVVHAADGTPRYLIGAVLDVHDNHTVRERMRVTLRSLADGFVATDPHGSITLINPEAARMLGIAEDAAAGQLLSRVVRLNPPLFRAIPDPDSDDTVVLTDTRLLRADGNSLHVSCSLAPIRETAAHPPQGFVLLMHDLTEARATLARLDTEEAQRRESQQRYALAMQGTNDGLWDWNAVTDELLLSPRLMEILGQPARQVVTPAEDWYTRIHPRDRQAFRDAIRAHIKGKTPYFQQECRVRKAPRGYLWIQARGLALRDTRGHAYRMIGSVGDISARKHYERALQRLNQDLEQRVAERTRQFEAAMHELESFSYSVSHDLRAPLRAIDGYSAILLDDYGKVLDDEAQTLLTRMRAAVQRMGHLIDALLKLSRVGRQPLERQRTDLSAIARAIVTDLQQRDPARHVDVAIEDALIEDADPGLSGIVLQNLFENAWKFSARRPDAEIHFLRVRAPEGDRAYLVEDNGAGFDMRYQDKLYAPFQRLHHERDFQGTGIGLATVARIVHRHGGRIWADSAPGEGARFYFTLKPQTASPNAVPTATGQPET